MVLGEVLFMPTRSFVESVTITSVSINKSVAVKVPPTEASSVTVKSSCTFRSTTERLAKASTTAAPEPAPSR